MKQILEKFSICIYVLTGVLCLVFLLHLFSYFGIYKKDAVRVYRIEDAFYSDLEKIRNEITNLDFIDNVYFEKYEGTLSSSTHHEIHSFNNYNNLFDNQDTELVYGRYPEKEDEILITSLDYIESNILSLNYGVLDCLGYSIDSRTCSSKIISPNYKTFKIVGLITPKDKRATYYTYTSNMDYNDKGTLILKIKNSYKKLTEEDKNSLISLQKRYNRDIVNCSSNDDCFRYNEWLFSNIYFNNSGNYPTFGKNITHLIWMILFTIVGFGLLFLLEYLYFTNKKNMVISNTRDGISVLAIGSILSIIMLTFFAKTYHINVIRPSGAKNYQESILFVNGEINKITGDIKTMYNVSFVHAKDRVLDLEFKNYNGKIELYKYALKNNFKIANISNIENYNPYYSVKYIDFFNTLNIYIALYGLSILIFVILNKVHYKADIEMHSFKPTPIIFIEDTKKEERRTFRDTAPVTRSYTAPEKKINISKIHSRKEVFNKEKKEEIKDDSHDIIYIKK